MDQYFYLHRDYLQVFKSDSVVRDSEKMNLLLSCFKYLLKRYFTFKIFDTRLEPTLKVSTIDFLFVIVTLFNGNEFGDYYYFFIFINLFNVDSNKICS